MSVTAIGSIDVDVEWRVCTERRAWAELSTTARCCGIRDASWHIVQVDNGTTDGTDRRVATTAREVSPTFGLTFAVADDFAADLEFAIPWIVWWETIVHEVNTEYRCQSPADMVAEGDAQTSGTLVRQPVPLCGESATRDGVC